MQGRVIADDQTKVYCLNNYLTLPDMFLDISMALDLVDHEIMLQKLKYYGARTITFQIYVHGQSSRAVV